jgi:RNA polymerase-binding protein DksA
VPRARATPAQAAPAASATTTATTTTSPVKSATPRSGARTTPAKPASTTSRAGKSTPRTSSARSAAQPAADPAAQSGANPTTRSAARSGPKSGTAKASTKPSGTARSAPARSGPARASRATAPNAEASSLLVREDEAPWTPEELQEVRSGLEGDVARLSAEIDVATSELQQLLRDSGEGTGDDQADAGAKTFEREQEITLANNSRGMLEQSQRALARLDDGSYGACESCGRPVGKMRLQAFPRATLCVSCKQLQERR